MNQKRHRSTRPNREAGTEVTDEQRGEERRPAQGEVRLFMGDVPSEIRGRLLDTSHSGFRVAHSVATLRSGQIVGFEHSGSEGTARAIWTRIVGDCVESGFLILDVPPTPSSPSTASRLDS